MADNPFYRPYGDPAIKQGFDDLGKIFAPPTAQEIYAGVKAQAERQKMQSVADYYKMANDPSVDPRKLDVLAAGANLYNPTQGWTALGTHSADMRRGQDLTFAGTKYSADATAGAARYGHDLGYKASIYKTDADNATSRSNNAADNQRAMDVAMITPVAKDATRFVPPNIADMYKVPQTQTGVVAAAPGEKNYVPDATGMPGGRGVLEGNAKPQTLEEAKAAQFNTMPQDVKDAIVFGPTPLEVVPGANGQSGTPMTRPQVLAGGKAPVDRAHQPQIFNYRTPDGKTGMGTITNGIPVDATTGQPLPQGVAGQALSGVQSKDPLGATTANVTEANRKAANLDVFEKSLNDYEALLKANPGIVGIPGAVRGAAQNAVSVAEEFANAFGKLSPMARVTEDQVKQYAAQIGATTRDPAIAQSRIMEADLAYKWAQTQNSSGEVSRYAFERALEAVTGGTLRNNQSALESVTGMRQFIARERQGVSSLRTPGQTPQSAAPPAAAPGSIQTQHGTVTFEPVQ